MAFRRGDQGRDRPGAIGADPLDLADCESRCVPPWQITANTGENASSVAFGAVELALWEIRGKVFGMPLYKLLGGAVRKEIPFPSISRFGPPMRVLAAR